MTEFRTKLSECSHSANFVFYRLSCGSAKLVRVEFDGGGESLAEWFTHSCVEYWETLLSELRKPMAIVA